MSSANLLLSTRDLLLPDSVPECSEASDLGLARNTEAAEAGVSEVDSSATECCGFCPGDALRLKLIAEVLF